LHVGGIKSLPHLPGLAEKRSKQPQIRFYTYGTHEDVNPSRWHLREVFPIGEWANGAFLFDVTSPRRCCYVHPTSHPR
jgi:hypothetical protein